MLSVYRLFQLAKLNRNPESSFTFASVRAGRTCGVLAGPRVPFLLQFFKHCADMRLLLSGDSNRQFRRRVFGRVTGRRGQELIRGTVDPTPFPS